MAECSFCGEPIPRGTGVMFVRTDAKVFWFCSRKCEKNLLKLRRKPVAWRWTAEARAAKGKALRAAERGGDRS